MEATNTVENILDRCPMLRERYIHTEYPNLIDVCIHVQDILDSSVKGKTGHLHIDDLGVRDLGHYVSLLKDGHRKAVDIYNRTYNRIFKPLN